jgi:NADPH:quinone reductase-like Zn-dependent oxidoreductase
MAARDGLRRRRRHCCSPTWKASVPLCPSLSFSLTQLTVLGAKVIAAASTQEKLDVSRKYGGADYVVDYSKPDWQKEVLKITGGRGVDVVYDPVGMIRDCLKCAAWKCRLLVIGFAGGEIEKVCQA